MQNPETGKELDAKINSFLQKKNLPLQLRLDLMDVFFQLRPAARILVRPEEEARDVCQSILSVGCHIAVGKGLKWQPKSSVVTCHDWFSKKSSPKELESMVVLYVAASQAEANQARAADETKNDAVFARALGYPNCCIEWVRSRKSVPELSDCIELYASEGNYDPLIWPGAMLHDASLTPHYPCSTSCVHSQDLARARIKLLYKLGCFEILSRIIGSRELVYFVDYERKLRTASIANFKLGDHYLCAMPSTPAAERLNIPI